MGQPRQAKRTGEGPCAEDGPPPPFRSWQAPPDGLFDVIVPTLTAKQFVVVQLVCKDWSRSARYCLKDATPKRPDVDLSKLVSLYPNLTQLNLSHVEGLTTRMLYPLRQLTALRELCLSNIALKQSHRDTTNAGDGAPPGAQGAVPGAPGGAPLAAAPATARVTRGTSGHHRTPLKSPQPWTRSRARGAAQGAHGGTGTRATASHGAAPAASDRSPAAVQPHSRGVAGTDTSSDRAGDAAATGDGEATVGSPSVCIPPHPQSRQQEAGSGSTAHAAEADGGAGPGGSGGDGSVGVVGDSPGSSPPSSPASRIFGGLGDVLLRLSKLQADLCPALSADAIACLPNLTDLTLDTLVAPEALAPLGRLRCLAVKKLANAEALERLSGLTALLINSDSSCASEFLPVCTRLPALQSLTFKTSSTKVLQQPDLLCWQGFSRLSSLDLRAPAECLKPGLPALSELGALRSLSLDLYCASDEELMVTVVAPPNLESLFVSSDRSRSGGVIDVHPNPRLRSMRIRLYWTALNLVLPEGVPEPSPLPEPLTEDLEAGPSPNPRSPVPLPGGGGRRTPVADRLAGVAYRQEAAAAGTAAAGAGGQPADVDHAGLREGGAAAAGDLVEGTGQIRRGLRRRRDSEDSPSPEGLMPGAAGPAGTASGERGPRRRTLEAAGALATAAAVEPSSGGRGTAAAMVAGDSSEDDSGGSAGAGSDGGSSGEEVGFRGLGAGPSAAAAAAAAAVTAVVVATAGGSDGVGAEEKADADSGRRPPVTATGDAAAAADAAMIEQRVSRRHSAPLTDRPPAAVQGAAAAAAGPAPPPPTAENSTPAPDRRRSGGSVCRDSVGDGAPGVATPVASTGGARIPGGTPGTTTNIPEMELQELCLDACFFLLYGSLVPLLRQFPHLRKLTLDNCLALENGELAQLCELSSLRELSLSGLHLVTDTGLRALGRLPHLTSLRVKGLRKLSVHAAQAYMRQKPIVRRYEEISGSFLASLAGLSDLRSLALKHLHTASEGSLAAGLGALTQLTRLEVKDVHAMSDKVLMALTRHTSLQDLSVLHCEAVTARGRNAVVKSLGQRVALDFEGCSLPDITRPCALPTTSTQAQLIDDDQVSSSNQPRPSFQHSNQH